METRFYFRGKTNRAIDGYFTTNSPYTGYNLAIYQGCDPDTAENFRCWLEAAQPEESYDCFEFYAEVAKDEVTDETIKSYTTLEQCDARIETLNAAFEGAQAEIDKLIDQAFGSAERISARGFNEYNRQVERIDELKAYQREIQDKVHDCYHRIYQLTGQE